jgi:hypothetical protein
MQLPKNIQGAFDITPREWRNLAGKKLHLRVCGGQATGDALFVGLMEGVEGQSLGIYVPPDEEGDNIHPFTRNHLSNIYGVRVTLNERDIFLYWGDIVEMWPLEKKCDNCDGRGKLSDSVTKSRFSALDWLSYDGESCTACRGSGKVVIVYSSESAG